MSSDDGHDSNTQSNRSHDHLPLSRRSYLQYTGAVAVGSIPATGSTVATEERKDRINAGHVTPPTNLRVEYERQPNNLRPDGTPPRFFWEVPTDRRATIQTAYRILVAESASALRNQSGIVWDSGVTESRQTTAVEYDGPVLDPDTTYHWVVRVWDGDGTGSFWGTSSFMTAISGSEEHREGEWIGADLDEIDLPEGFRDEVTLNPHFLGAIDEWFYRYLAGIRTPSEPGFEHIDIAPLPVEDLDHAEARSRRAGNESNGPTRHGRETGLC